MIARIRRFERAGQPGVCPLCGLIVAADDPVGLLPWKRTDDLRIVEAKPAHWSCITSPEYAAILDEAGIEVIP